MALLSVNVSCLAVCDPWECSIKQHLNCCSNQRLQPKLELCTVPDQKPNSQSGNMYYRNQNPDKPAYHAFNGKFMNSRLITSNTAWHCYPPHLSPVLRPHSVTEHREHTLNTGVGLWWANVRWTPFHRNLCYRAVSSLSHGHH